MLCPYASHLGALEDSIIPLPQCALSFDIAATTVTKSVAHFRSFFLFKWFYVASTHFSLLALHRFTVSECWVKYRERERERENFVYTELLNSNFHHSLRIT